MWHYVFAPSERRITYWITRLRTFMFRFLCGIMFSLLLREELHIVRWLAFNNFKKLPTSLLSKVALSLYIPTSNRKAPVPPQPRLHLLFYYQHLPFCHSHPGGEGVIVILIGSSRTMTNYGKHLLTFMLAIQIFPLDTYLLISFAQFLIGLGAFSYWVLRVCFWLWVLVSPRELFACSA